MKFHKFFMTVGQKCQVFILPLIIFLNYLITLNNLIKFSSYGRVLVKEQNTRPNSAAGVSTFNDFNEYNNLGAHGNVKHQQKMDAYKL